MARRCGRVASEPDVDATAFGAIGAYRGARAKRAAGGCAADLAGAPAAEPVVPRGGSAARRAEAAATLLAGRSCEAASDCRRPRRIVHESFPAMGGGDHMSDTMKRD